MGFLDGFTGIVRQLFIVGFNYIIKGVRGNCRVRQIHHIVIHPYISRTANRAVNGNDIVGIVLTGMPAEPRFHRIQSVLCLSVHIQIVRVADFRIAYLIGNIPATFDNLLDTVIGSTKVSRIIMIDKNRSIGFSSVIAGFPVIVKRCGVFFQQISHVNHVAVPVGSVIFGNVDFFHSAITISIRRIIVITTCGHHSAQRQHASCNIQKILFHFHRYYLRLIYYFFINQPT